MRSKTMLVILTLLLVGLLAVSCSSPTVTPTEAPGTEVEGAAHQETEAGHAHEKGKGHAQEASVIEGAREVHVTATEFAYEPKTITITQGKPVTLVVTSKGAIEHEIDVGTFGLHLHVKPGETAKGSFIPDRAGTFQFACEIPGHPEAGMVMTMIVEPSDAGIDSSSGEAHHHDLHIEMKQLGHWHIFSAKNLTFTVRNDHDEVVSGLSPVFTYQRAGSDRVGKHTLADGQIAENGDGTYSVEYTPSDSGAYAFTFQVEQEGQKYFAAWPMEVVWDGEEGINRTVDAVDYVYQIRYEEEVQTLAILQERERLAREMHDGLAQLLGYVNTKAQAVKELLRVGQLEAAAQDTYDDVREGVLALSTNEHKRPFLESLGDYVQRFSDLSGVPSEMVVDGAPWTFDSESEVQLVRIVQETLANAREHARATNARVVFSFQGHSCRLVIQDNGRGFDPERIARGPRPHLGLWSIQERAAAIGARFTVDTAPGRGTRVILDLPRVKI